ncbi:MAG: hypothetical protein J6Z01_06215 [Bacteroidales bacterium]|nr:hypothetical protein [Bacteroidales bacterium]
MDIVSGVGEVLSAPVKVLSDWASEPLKAFQANRDRKDKDKEVERKIREADALSKIHQAEQAATVENQIIQETKKGKIISEIKVEEAKKLSQISIAKKESEADLQIKMQTEVNRISVEIEEMQKDRQFERMKKVTEAIAKYKKDLTDLNINTIRAIGDMDLDLRQKAQNLVLEKTKEFMAIQEAEIEKAGNKFLEIEEKFAGKPSYDAMIMATQTKLASVIEITDNFMKQLNEQIVKMTDNINVLMQGGQEFITRQLDRFNTIQSGRILDNVSDTTYTIENQ